MPGVSEPVDSIPRGVAVVIGDAGVLLIRRWRAGHVYAVLPGGHVEPPESRADAALRELTEETTLSARIEKLLWTRDDGCRPASYFLMRDVVGTPTLAGEEAERHTAENSYELVWASAADFEPFNLRPLAVRDLLSELMRHGD